MAGHFCGSNVIPDVFIPLLFPGTISEQVKKIANKSLAGKLDYKAVHLTFFRHFPSLTVSVDDLLLKGPKPFQNDTLLAAKKWRISFKEFNSRELALFNSNAPESSIMRFVVELGGVKGKMDEVIHLDALSVITSKSAPSYLDIYPCYHIK